jgi:hypothetical protein
MMMVQVISKKAKLQFLLFLISLALLPHDAIGLATLKSIARPIVKGYARRIKADPSFALKSVTEVFLAAGTQFTAELSKRGADRIVPEIDFVFAGVLTAVAGKYYSMWRVAPTLLDDENDELDNNDNLKGKADDQQVRLGNMIVPTNAFQPTMSDGISKPTRQQRLGSIIAPMVPLFRAGILASAVGYGFTAFLIAFRSFCMPDYVPATQNINIIHACIYTGGFMALVSNLRYQLLQGIIEPSIDRCFQKIPTFRAFLVFSVRWANGFLGSYLAITGMKAMGLQKLK